MRKISITLTLFTLALSLLMIVNGSGHSVLNLSSGSQLANSEVIYLNGESSFPRRVIDPIGRSIRLDSPPKVIVSGILAGDEMLTRLVPQDRIRSITYLSDDPGISNVAGFYPDSIKRNRNKIEEVIAAEPDLVLVAAYSNAVTVEMLLNTGIPIIRFANFHSHDHIRNNVRTLAKALGAEKNAETWLAEMDATIAITEQKVKGFKKPRVLYYNLSGSTAGPGSLMDETINFAGGLNVIAETGLKAYTRISPEMAIGLQPDVILLNDWKPEGGKSAKQILLENPAWQDVPAIKNGRVYGLRGAWLTSGSPYRVKGIEEIARLLHPKAFDASPNHQEIF